LEKGGVGINAGEGGTPKEGKSEEGGRDKKKTVTPDRALGGGGHYNFCKKQQQYQMKETQPVTPASAREPITQGKQKHH